ncbi:hypothetical protein ACFLTB_04130 [Chloroflexota bacterium]
MNKNRMRLTSGILSLIGGILQFGALTYFIYRTIDKFPKLGPNPVRSIMLSLAVEIPLLVMGILAVTGGILILKRKRRKLAFIGAVFAYLPLWLIVLLGFDFHLTFEYTEYFISWLLLFILLLLQVLTPVLAYRARAEFI